MQVLTLLLQHGTPRCDLGNIPTNFSDYPLHFCASMCAEPELIDCAIAMTRALKLYGADVNAVNGAGHTPAQVPCNFLCVHACVRVYIIYIYI
jgi:hypothetical protein